MAEKTVRKQGKHAILIAASVLVTIGATEIALRMADISYPRFYQYDSLLGGALRPGVEGWWHKEGKALVRINSDGWRDREHDLQKQPDVVRVAVLGDSYVEAFQVPEDKTFWAVMEANLDNCYAKRGRKAEVLSFGVSGYGTAQELLVLRNKVWKYSPDVVVLAVTTGNDIRNNSRWLEPEKMRPFFVNQSEGLIEDYSFRDTPAFRKGNSVLRQVVQRLSNHSRLLQVAIEAYLRVRTANAFVGKRLDDETAEMGLDNEVYRQPITAEWKDAWKITEGLIAIMHREVMRHGAKFLVVTLSNGIQVHPNRQVRQSYMSRLGISDLFYPERRIRALGERLNFRVLNLAPAMQVYAEQNQVYLHGFMNTKLGDGHWNEHGHRFAGMTIARELCSLR